MDDTCRLIVDAHNDDPDVRMDVHYIDGGLVFPFLGNDRSTTTRSGRRRPRYDKNRCESDEKLCQCVCLRAVLRGERRVCRTLPVPTRLLSHWLDGLRRTTAVQEAVDATDADLLRRYCQGREETAFATLVQRHGPLVLAACRRVLRDANDADDAFQATFCVLARKAGAVRQPDRLGKKRGFSLTAIHGSRGDSGTGLPRVGAPLHGSVRIPQTVCPEIQR
jgi:hypothetical protein